MRRASALYFVASATKKLIPSTRFTPAHVGTSNPAPGAPSKTDADAAPLGGAEAGPNEDIFWVYSRDPDGQVTGPIWQKTLKDGLDAPQLVLFEKFKEAVNAAVAERTKNQSVAKKPTP